jgi:phosphoribosylanthranilate isomerase
MKIKICGLKTIEDSRTACAAGADMLGFNFYESSPRNIGIASCRVIIEEIKGNFPEIICVGIFVNHDPHQIRTIMAETGLDLAQLSGNEPPIDLKLLGALAFKALRPVSLHEVKLAINAFPAREIPPAFLIDKHQKEAYGGTGKKGNWKLAAEIAKEHPVLLAGGLNPENVAAAIQEVRPWGVDVASGVEIERGKKDQEKIIEFIQIVRTTSFKTSND